MCTIMMDKELIDRVISNTASPEEANEVARWFATQEGQEYLSHRFEKEALSLNENGIEEYDPDNIPSSRMKERLLSTIDRNIKSTRFRKIAAILLPFIIMVGISLFAGYRLGLMGKKQYASIQVPLGEQMNVILQDGTRVQMNSGSSITYPKTFGLFNRKIEFSGEAYFMVSKEPSRPFFVNLGEIQVKVTGTKFNVKAYSDDPEMSVTLEEGRVSLIDKNKHGYPLQINQNALYTKATNLFQITNVDEMEIYTAWRSKSLNFNNIPLKEILKVIGRQYNVSFTTKDTICMQYKFSISTENVNVDDVLHELEKVSDIRFTKQDKNSYFVYLTK